MVLLSLYLHYFKFCANQIFALSFFSSSDFPIFKSCENFDAAKISYIYVRTYLKLFVSFVGLDVYTMLHRKNIILTLEAVQELEEYLCEDDRILRNQFD